MRLKAYSIVGEAVEQGLACGISRLFKHEDGPFDEVQLRERSEKLYDGVMNALCDVIDFDNDAP
jgi:hypothetical protein